MTAETPVRFLAPMSIAGRSVQADQILHLPPEQAAHWLAAGLAVLVQDAAPAEALPQAAVDATHPLADDPMVPPGFLPRRA